MLPINIDWVFGTAANFMLFTNAKQKIKLNFIVYQEDFVAQRTCLLRLIISPESISSSFLVF